MWLSAIGIHEIVLLVTAAVPIEWLYDKTNMCFSSYEESKLTDELVDRLQICKIMGHWDNASHP